MRPIRTLLAVPLMLGAFALAACAPSKDDDLALLGAPVVGDVYAAQLSEFSAYEFTAEDKTPIDPAYGLMKVVTVDGDGVVVITENNALASPTQSRQDLRGDMADIGFDDSERIGITLAHLRAAYDDGLIYAVHRPTAP